MKPSKRIIIFRPWFLLFMLFSLNVVAYMLVISPKIFILQDQADGYARMAGRLSAGEKFQREGVQYLDPDAQDQEMTKFLANRNILMTSYGKYISSSTAKSSFTTEYNIAMKTYEVLLKKREMKKTKEIMDEHRRQKANPKPELHDFPAAPNPDVSSIRGSDLTS